MGELITKYCILYEMQVGIVPYELDKDLSPVAIGLRVPPEPLTFLLCNGSFLPNTLERKREYGSSFPTNNNPLGRECEHGKCVYNMMKQFGLIAGAANFFNSDIQAMKARDIFDLNGVVSIPSLVDDDTPDYTRDVEGGSMHQEVEQEKGCLAGLFGIY